MDKSGWWFGTWLLFYPIVGMMIQSDYFFSGGWNHQLDIEQGKSMEHQNGWDNPRFSSIFHGEYTMLPPEFGAEHRHFLKITIFEALWIPILKTNQNLVNWKFRMIQAAGDLPQFSVKRQCERSFDAERLISGLLDTFFAPHAAWPKILVHI